MVRNLIRSRAIVLPVRAVVASYLVIALVIMVITAILTRHHLKNHASNCYQDNSSLSTLHLRPPMSPSVVYIAGETLVNGIYKPRVREELSIFHPPTCPSK